MHDTERLERFGVHLEGRAVPDFSRIMRRKDRAVRRFQKAKVESIEASDYEVIPGRGRFVEGGRVCVGDRLLEARSYVIATGSAPTVPEIDGIDEVRVLTSDDVMELTEQPRRLIVQGAGPIGLELGQFFSRIGTEVVVVNRSPILWRCDREAGAELARALNAESNLEPRLSTTIERLRPKGDGLVATLRTETGDQEVEADALLTAIGRHALVDDLGLEHLGLETAGSILRHDDTLQTANPRVFVAGDATGGYQVLHMSNQEGRVAGHNAAVEEPERRMDYRLKMQVFFTDPPYASVGYSEQEAERVACDLVVGTARFPETGRAITMEVEHGLWKLLADGHSGEIIGSSILGPRADDLIHEIATMMHYGGKVDDILDMPWYHPTLSEVVLELARSIRRSRQG